MPLLVLHSTPPKQQQQPQTQPQPQLQTPNHVSSIPSNSAASSSAAPAASLAYDSEKKKSG